MQSLAPAGAGAAAGRPRPRRGVRAESAAARKWANRTSSTVFGTGLLLPCFRLGRGEMQRRVGASLARSLSLLQSAQIALALLALAAAAAVKSRHGELEVARLARASSEWACIQAGSTRLGLQWGLRDGRECRTEWGGRACSCMRTGTARLHMARLALRGGASDVDAPPDIEAASKRSRDAHGWDDERAAKRASQTGVDDAASEEELRDAQLAQAWRVIADADAPVVPGAMGAGAHAGGGNLSVVEVGTGEGESRGPTGDDLYVLPSVLVPQMVTAEMQEFTSNMLREIPFLEQEEHLEGDRQYARELEEKRRVRLGDPRRGAEDCSGRAAAKWRFIGGQSEAGEGILDFHLLAMHEEHKTALAFFKLTLDATCRFMPGRKGPAYLLFSDSSCSQVDYWLPDNITNTPGVNDDPEEPPEAFLNPILYKKILTNHSSGRRLAQHGLDFGPFWRARELGDYILVTHAKSDMQLWLTDEGFVSLAEGNGRLSAVVRNASLLAEWDYSGENPNWLATSCLRHTGDSSLPRRQEALDLLARDSAGFEADAKQTLAENMEAFLAYTARRRTDNYPTADPPSASQSTFSSDYDVFEQLLDNGESSAGLASFLCVSCAHGTVQACSPSSLPPLSTSSLYQHMMTFSLSPAPSPHNPPHPPTPSPGPHPPSPLSRPPPRSAVDSC